MAIKASSQISIVDVSDGETGKGVASVTPEYYLSSSKTTQTGGSWSTTPPTWSNGKYLWVRQIVTYTDSSVSRTQPYCDTSWEAVKEVQVGGRNIATGTATLTIGTGGHSVGHWRKTGNGTVENIDIIDSPVASINKGVRITSTNATSQIGICQDSVPLNSDDIYTVSCWVRSNSSSGVPCRLQSFYKSSTDNSGATRDIMITDSWKRISFVSIRSPQITGEYYGAYVVLRPTEVRNYIDVCGIKFEAGNKPTDWSPAPEDVEADATKKANEAAKTATNYMNFDDNGLVIGDMTAGTLGKNVLIDNDSVDIRNGDTVLASYGDNIIWLGKNSRASTIDLCDGAATIYNLSDKNTDLNYNRLAIESTNTITLKTTEGIYNDIFMSDDSGEYYVSICGSTTSRWSGKTDDEIIVNNSVISLQTNKISQYNTEFDESMDGNIYIENDSILIKTVRQRLVAGSKPVNPRSVASIKLDCDNDFSSIDISAAQLNIDANCYINSKCTISNIVEISGTLILSNTRDASGTADNSPALIVGGTSTQPHLEFDANEIMAKSNGTTPTTLSLNVDGGQVYVGSGGIKTPGNVIGICQIVKMGSSPTRIKYQSHRTKALIEFWKTSVGTGSNNPSHTVYDSSYVTGLSNKMTAVPGTTIKSGPDFSFVYSISSAGEISVSGDFSKYRVTYFN